ncbi:MAG: hypothetical protein FWH00_01910, partial [Oscillospiraceae bacterium]|nr:hypothetical protein [Oscillospiraceae bacterium]
MAENENLQNQNTPAEDSGGALPRRQPLRSPLPQRSSGEEIHDNNPLDFEKYRLPESPAPASASI